MNLQLILILMSQQSKIEHLQGHDLSNKLGKFENDCRATIYRGH